ncbi:Alkaline phosphatase synthesis sensor protein PhoR [compost metagenome]
MAVNARSPEATLRAFSQGAGAFVALIGLLTFLSEAFALGPITQALHAIPIQPNQQALMAMILGFALFLVHVKSPWTRQLAQGLGLAVSAYCLFVIAEILMGLRLGLGELAFPQGFGTLSGEMFTRMSLPSAIELAMLGLALALGARRRGWPSDLLALTTLGYLFITAVMVALNVQHRYGTAFMLPAGALLLSILAFGVLCAHPDRGLMQAITSETLVGVVLRRLLPTALLAPTIIAWAWAQGLRIGLFDAPVGMFFAFLATTVFALALVGWNIIPLARLEHDRNEALAALQASEANARPLAAIVEASQDAITTYDPKTWTLTFWSQGAEKLWGWTSGEALGKRVGFLTHIEDQPVFRDAFVDLQAGKPVSIQDIKATRRDGEQRDVSVSIFPIRDEQGLIVAFGSIQRDITEQRHTLVEMARRTAELKKSEELNRLKDHFLSTISHEMKTPLSLITGYAELLEDACPDETMIEGIKEGSRRLSEHINNILDYSALISGTLPLYKTDVCPAEVVDHVIPLLREGFEQQQITLEIDVSPDTPIIAGDFRRISQILLELLENAQKFTPPGGKAGVRIGPADGNVRLDVWNTGEGIPEEDFSRIWEAFSQLATEDAFRKGGLGLGLTIVKRLVELHGGRVAVASQIGRGTTFTVYLPTGAPRGCPEPEATRQESERRGSA